jgi:hypothetical protein
MKMNLELAVTINCSETGCQVQLVSNDKVISTHYSALVLDRIRIQKQQLVAIDTSPPIPEIVWRWVRAIVLEVNDDSIGIEDRMGQIEFASRVSILPLSLSIGDEVWFCKTDQELEVHDLIVNGKPAHPYQLIEYITPIIERVYAV